MILKAYTLLSISIIGILLVSITFFINFKYLPLASTKVGLILAFSYLGYKSYLWIRLIKTENTNVEESEKYKGTKNIFIIEYLILGMIGIIAFYFTERSFLIPFFIIFILSLYTLIKKYKKNRFRNGNIIMFREHCTNKLKSMKNISNDKLYKQISNIFYDVQKSISTKNIEQQNLLFTSSFF